MSIFEVGMLVKGADGAVHMVLRLDRHSGLISVSDVEPWSPYTDWVPLRNIPDAEEHAAAQRASAASTVGK